MDEIDRMILAELQQDARISNQELADRVGLTPSPCLRRVQRLEEKGVIRGYRAVIDPEAVGRSFQTFVYVSIAPEDRKTILGWEEGLAKVEDVIEAYRMIGEPDYVLRVAVQDIEAYESVYTDQLAVLPGVANMTTQLPLKTVKTNEGFPL